MTKRLRKTVRSKLRGLIVPAASTLVIAYFAYHVFHGEHGILAWRQMEYEATTLQTELAARQADRQALEARVALLRPESLDPDLLEELVRQSLSFAAASDIVVFYR